MFQEPGGKLKRAAARGRRINDGDALHAIVAAGPTDRTPQRGGRGGRGGRRGTLRRDSTMASSPQHQGMFTTPMASFSTTGKAQPLLAQQLEPTCNDLQRVVRKLRAVQCSSALEYHGRQCEEGSSGEYAEHEFTLSTDGTHQAVIKWRCTRSVNAAERPARSWVTEHVDLIQPVTQTWPTCKFRARPAPNVSPCEYTFELRYSGLLIVMSDAKLMTTDEPPLQQMIWGLLKDKVLQPRMAVKPVPACVCHFGHSYFCG